MALPQELAMKPLVRAVFGTLLVLTIQSTLFAQDAAPASPSPLAKLDLQDGDSIVFLGDSITHQVLYTQYVEDYFYTRYPKMRLKFHNAGVGGARCWDALQRFDRDVAAYKPKYVTILLGMNDGSYQPYNNDVFQTYRKDMNEVLKRIKEIGATPILMTPTMYDARPARQTKGWLNEEGKTFYNSTLAYYGTWLRDVAMENGYGFVDMWGPLNTITFEQRQKDPKFTMIKDSVHPEEVGQLVMAASIIHDLNLPRRMSTIRIAHGKNGELKAQKPQGGTLTDLVTESDRVEFTWTADSLPWVVPEKAQPGVPLVKLGQLTGEWLEVHGLAPGRYTLTIDGVEVGTYASDALEKHIELQGNDKTPQYQQALEVANRNKNRSEGPVKKMRDAWGQFQHYTHVKRNHEAKPDDEKLTKEFNDLEKAVADLDQRVATFKAEAQTIEDEIFQKNQPKPRKYVLQRATNAQAAK